MGIRIARHSDGIDARYLTRSSLWMMASHARLAWVTLAGLQEGDDGEINCSLRGLAHLSGLTVEEAIDALRLLLAPDEYACSERSPEGRKIERTDRGWRLLFTGRRSSGRSTVDDRPWSTYIVEAMETEPRMVKIGRSRSPDDRLASLDETSPVPLRRLLLIEEDVEAELHERFAADRVRREWFRFSADIRAFVQEHQCQ